MKVFGLAVALLGVASAAFAGTTGPEIDAATGAAAVALLAGGILVLRGRRRKQ